jgi:hypothetical protein
MGAVRQRSLVAFAPTHDATMNDDEPCRTEPNETENGDAGIVATAR